jgi:hypothetical protein
MKNITYMDWVLIQDILNKVVNCMQPDEVLTESEGMLIYSDGGDFLHSMTKSELDQLKEIIN